MSLLRKLNRLPWSDRVLLVRAGLLTVVVRLALDLLPFRLWRAWLIHREPPAPARVSRDVISIADRCAWAARVASRFFPRSDTCLVHAIVAQRLLRSRGIDSVVQIGVARGADAKFEAHAWVEMGGRVVIGDNPSRDLDDRFRRLFLLGRGSDGARKG